MDTFLSEVCRVLRPGGRFFFADLRSRDGVYILRERFKACDLTVESHNYPIAMEWVIARDRGQLT